MSTKSNIRVLNTDGKKKEVEIPWKTIMMGSALAAIAGHVAVEMFKHFSTRAKRVVQDDKTQNPMPQLPGAVSPGMFTSPYSQLAALQGFPAPFQNPMIMPADDDEPPKWFSKFKEEHEQRIQELEQQYSTKNKVAHATRLIAVADEYEEDEEYEDEDVA